MFQPFLHYQYWPEQILMLVDVATCEKTPLSQLYIKTNILPTQARDKHRENSKKMPFFAPVAQTTASSLKSSSCVCREPVLANDHSLV
jgi:hypothetical protein